MGARLQVLIASLLAGIIVLVGLPAAAQASESVVLQLGSRGAAVVTLQRDFHLRADGVFGRQTQQAVIAFQRRHHLAADGVVGAMTWRALGGAPRAAVPVRRVTAPAVNASFVSRELAMVAAQRGKPYRWGAAGPNAFDCSGLVQYVFGRLGISLPRTTYAQYARLRHIPHSAVRPGDLIFVDNLGHVGIYAGYGVMWHAPHTGSSVKLSLVWDRNYVAARI